MYVCTMSSTTVAEWSEVTDTHTHTHTQAHTHTYKHINASPSLPQVIACQGGPYTYHLPARPSSPVFREAQKYVRAHLEKKWVPLFIAQPDFLARTAGGSRKERGSYTHTIAPNNKVRTWLVLWV